MWLVYAQSRYLEREALVTHDEAEAVRVFNGYKERRWDVIRAKIVEHDLGWVLDESREDVSAAADGGGDE